MPDEIVCIANGMRSSSACCGRGMIGAQKAILHTDYTCGHVRQKAGYRKGAQPVEWKF